MPDILLELIGSIYDAATNQSLWTLVIGKCTHMFRGGGGTVAIYDVDRRNILEYVSVGIPQDRVKEYVDHVVGEDPRIAWALANRSVGTYFDRLHTTEAEMNRSPFYGWLAQNGFRYSIAHQAYEGGIRACFSLQRTSAQGHVQDADIALFEQVAPHMVRSMFLARRMGGLDLGRSSGEDAFEQLPIGVIFVDADGHPLQANRVAREIAAANDGMSIRQNRIIAARTDDDTLLQRALAGAIATTQGHGTGAGDLVSLGRPSGRRPLALRVSPVSRHGAIFAERRPAAILFVRDPESVPCPPRDLLKRAYKLTPRECDVALALAAGQTLEQAAQTHGLARATVRVHLRSLLHKTETHSQSALVRLMLAMVPGTERS